MHTTGRGVLVRLIGIRAWQHSRAQHRVHGHWEVVGRSAADHWPILDGRRTLIGWLSGGRWTVVRRSLDVRWLSVGRLVPPQLKTGGSFFSRSGFAGPGSNKRDKDFIRRELGRPGSVLAEGSDLGSSGFSKKKHN